MEQADLPIEKLTRFVRQKMDRKVILVAVTGDHASGFARPDTPMVLQGIHVEPTESLIGLNTAHTSFNWVGEFEGLLIDYSSLEIGPACPQLLKGDGTILERSLAPAQIVASEDLRRWQRVCQASICRRFFNHYRNFSKGVLSDFEGRTPCTPRRCLSAYRLGLPGVHLLRTGVVQVRLLELAERYGFGKLKELAQLHATEASARVEQDSPWVNRMAKLHALLENAYETSELAVDPPNPADVEEYLLDMRRRFFDAHTVVQQD